MFICFLFRVEVVVILDCWCALVFVFGLVSRAHSLRVLCFRCHSWSCSWRLFVWCDCDCWLILIGDLGLSMLVWFSCGHVRHWLRDFFDFNWVWFSCGHLEIGLMGYQGIGCVFVVGRSGLICWLSWVSFWCCCMVIMWLYCHELVDRGSWSWGWMVGGDLFLIDLLYVKLEWWTSCDGIGWGPQISFDRIIMFLEIGWAIRQLSQF